MMDYTQLIDKLLRELNTRVGIVNIYDKDQQSMMSEILSEWGNYDEKKIIFEFLTEKDDEKTAEDEKYTNTGGSGYVKAGDYEKWKSDPKGFSGETFTKTPSGKYVPKKDDETGQKAEKELGKDVKANSDYAKKEKERADRVAKQNDSSEEKSDTDTTEGNGYTGSKNKTLVDTNPIESENYQMDLEPNDDDFNKRNEKSANPTPPEPLKLDGFIKNPKFPKRYTKVLERMVNSRITTETAKWTHFSDIEGGAGKISAQAGELMTMMGSTMSDDEWNEFSEALLKHEQELLDNHEDVFKKKNAKGKLVDNPGSRIIDKSWVKAATQSRKAIIDRLEKQYGEGTTIVASSWDAKGEAESLGIQDYKVNKGFSTDMYLRVKKPNGEEVLDEISLKKSKNVNFLNSGAGQFKEWLGDDLPDEINQSVYKENQRESIAATGQSIKSDIESLLSDNPEKSKELQKVFKSKGLDFNEALDNLQNGKGDYRKSSSVVMASIKSIADWPSWGKKNDKGPNEGGNTVAQQYLKEASEKQTKFIEASIKSLSENPKMKEGMMTSIREEFPLKAVSEGEETMAIGDMSLDKDTMVEIFGTSKYDDIKEKLTSEPGPPPFLGYQAEVGSDVIPIAEVSVREDGVGYGGQIKFEMKLDPRFANTLKDATQKVYSSNSK